MLKIKYLPKENTRDQKNGEDRGNRDKMKNEADEISDTACKKKEKITKQKIDMNGATWEKDIIIEEKTPHT